MTVLWLYLTYGNTSKYSAVSQNATGPGQKPPVSTSTGNNPYYVEIAAARWKPKGNW